MTKAITTLDMIRLILLWISPLIFLKGLFLIVSTTKAYDELEKKLNREIGGIKKRIIPAMETNIEFLHKWLLVRKKAVGLVCILCAMLMFFLLK